MPNEYISDCCVKILLSMNSGAIQGIVPSVYVLPIKPFAPSIISK